MSVVTFLFTDIEGSTRRWEADPDAMRMALETHNDVLREAVEAHDGPGLQLHRRRDVRRIRLSRVRPSTPRSPPSGSLSCRCGWGSRPARRNYADDDYFGTVLNRTARVMAAGHGGQILLDGATAGLLSGVDLISLGPRRLRDIAKPVDMFPSPSRGLRTEFPPLKTVDPTPGNLRPPTTSFIGREAELAELADGAEGAPAGDAHRRRRGRQDTACAGGRRAVWPTTSRRRVRDRACRGRRSRRGARRGRRRTRDHPAAWHERGRQRRRRIGGPVAAAGVRQLRTRPGRRRRHDRGDPGALRHGDNPGHQPRGAARCRRATLAGAIAGRSRRHRLVLPQRCSSIARRRWRPAFH